MRLNIRPLLVAISGLALLVAGCANRNADDVVHSKAAQAAQVLNRETTLNSAWRGQTYDALREAFGEPFMLMNIIGYRPLRTSLVVYAAADSKFSCIDAFTLVKEEKSGDWKVTDYFCR